MNRFLYIISFLVLAFGLSACAGSQPSKEDFVKWEKDCQTQKEITANNNTVYAAGECIDFHMVEGDKKDSVIVIIHGSHTNGGNPMSWMPKWGRYISNATDITTYVLAMPGYGSSTSNRFGKMIWTDRLIPSARLNYIKFTIEILKKLKNKHKAKKLYVFGHSSGADLATAISALAPNLIYKTIAFAGAYDYHFYFKRWGNYKPYAEIASVNYADKIVNTKILLLAGKKDELSWPIFTKHYEKILLDNNVDVSSFIFEDVKHSLRDVVIWDKVIEYINE